MSLRAFHILFIILAILMSAGCAWWGFSLGANVVFGATSAIVALGLSVYFVYFLRKTRKLIL